VIEKKNFLHWFLGGGRDWFFLFVCLLVLSLQFGDLTSSTCTWV
jgi:hypothetical protein